MNVHQYSIPHVKKNKTDKKKNPKQQQQTTLLWDKVGWIPHLYSISRSHKSYSRVTLQKKNKTALPHSKTY